MSAEQAVLLPLVLNARGSVYRAEYTDGTPVIVGDRIRYQQAKGGMLAPSGGWIEGEAVTMPETHRGLDWPVALVMRTDNGRLFNLVGHVIERIAA